MMVSGQLHILAALPLGKNPVPIEWESRWVPDLVWTFSRKENLLPLVGLEPRTVQLAASHYTN